ncbi:MAG: ATP-dependent Clp protease proteolytic subunit [Aureibaculum sp.]|nr:ATP-dependent Clp protease proteolytic subunit [Aureibaculum sp.]
MKKINTDLSDYIGSYAITALIDQVDSVKEDAEITWNSFGGSTYAGNKFIDFLNNKEYVLNANVTGLAASMGAVILPFFDNVRGAKQADVMIHAASGGVKSTLKHTNEFLYEALSKKIDEAKFKEITGKELKSVMLGEDEDRVDVWLTGAQAGEIGLFDETYSLLDKAAKLDVKVNIKELDYSLPEKIAIKYGFKQNKLEINSNDMEVKDITIDMLKANNVNVYNSIFEEGKKANQERVATISKYAKYDSEKANEIIESGRDLSIKDVEHFMEKKFNNKKVDELEIGSEGDLKAAKTTKVEIEKTAEQKEKEAALNEIDDFSGVNEQITNK